MPTSTPFTGLVIATPEQVQAVNAALPVCESFTLKDLDGWQKLLTPENDPETWFRFERQERNDCQAHGITGAVEIIHKRTQGRLAGVQLSRSYTYNKCERLSGFRLGSNQGTTIQSGVKQFTEIGGPTEADYPYDRYTANPQQFQLWESAVAESLPLAKIAKATLAPAWDTMIAGCALGHPLTAGFMWPFQRSAGTILGKKFYTKYDRNHGDGGHAVCPAFPVLLDSGQIVLKVINSHGDEYFFIDANFYEEARASSPFGMYQLYGHENPVQAYYDGQLGLFSGTTRS